MQWILGIDGGGTKTLGCAVDVSGKILGCVEKGPGNYHVVGLAGLTAVVRDTIAALCTKYGLSPDDLLVVSLGLAGVDRGRDREMVADALTELNLSCRYIINSDAKIALTAGIGETDGVILIAGTGSIAYGINQGKTVRAGGWGHLISDEGSGFAIGRKALLRAVKSFEHRDRPTVLLDRIMAFWQLHDWDSLIGFVNSPAANKTTVAALAALVITAAEEGDAVAREILTEAADNLSGLVESVIERGFGNKQVPVCTYGSILKNSTLIRQRLTSRLAGKATLIASDRDPVLGAVAIALDSLKG